MAAPSSTVPAAATGPIPNDVGVLTYLKEVLSGTATVLQEAPVAVAVEAAGLVQEVPVVGIVCKTFLFLEQLVETAKSNKDDLAVLLELCDVVIKGLLDKRSDRSGLRTGFNALEKCTASAKDVAKRCNGAGIGNKMKRGILARKICKDIASVRRDLLAFCSANNLVLTNDTNARVEEMEKNIVGQLKEMEKLTVTQKDYEAMGKSVALITKEREDLRTKVEAEEKSSSDLQAELRSSEQTLAAMETELQAKVGNVSDKEEELLIYQKKLEDMKKTVASKTEELDERDKELETRNEKSLVLETALVESKDALAAMKMELEEQRRIADIASKVKIPRGAPRIRDWFIERTAIVSQACGRLGIGSSIGDAVEEPRMVGLAGPGGAGKSTIASMVVAREDVRAFFHKGLLWLQIGQGAKVCLSELMLRLAGMVYEIVMLKACRPPRNAAGLDEDTEDGAAYIREVVDESSRRFLVVADDVWDVEVLRELKRAGVWVLFTTRQGDLLPEPPLRLDQVLMEEAELVLRRAAELGDEEHLPDAAYELMERCEFGVLYLGFVGRWSDVRGRGDEAWRRTLGRIQKAQRGDEGGKLLSWRAAVLRAGLEELACDNPKNKELYLSLGVLPKGLAFPSEVAAVLLYGEDLSPGDFEAAGGVVATLERLSILTMRGGGMYSVHDEHADFIQGCFAIYQGIRDRALPRWRGYISSAQAVLTFSSDWLVKIWEILVHCDDQDMPSRPYDAALDKMDPLSAELPIALEKVADFHWLLEDWLGAYSKLSQLLKIKENELGADHPDVARTLHYLGVYLSEAGRGKEAEGLYRRALAIREEKLGADHPDVARTLDNLGACLYNAGRTEEAEGFFRQALAIREEELGADHPDVARALHNLGVCLDNAARTEEAVELYRRALAIREEKLGADDPDVARTLYGLGVCLDKAGRTEEAEGLYRRALAIREEKLGADHPDVARTLHDLGACLSAAARGREEAEGFYRRALAIQEEKLGVDHPDVAFTLHNLGGCLHDAGRREEAEGFYRRALAIREEKLGADHPDVARTLHNLGVCLGNAGRTEEALELYRRALAIREEKLGADHPDVARTLDDLGVCLGKAGRRTEEAEGFYRRALAIREEKLGVDHPDVAFTLHNLGVCLDNAGRREEAEGFYRRALAIREEKLGADHPDVARTLHSLGVCLGKAGRTEEAEGLYRRALAIQEEKLGVDHPDVAFTLHELGVFLDKAGRREEAEGFYRRALAIREEKLGVDHPDVARTLHNLGMCLDKAGRREEAEGFYRRALAIQEEKLGVDHPDVARTLHNLGMCLCGAGRREEAEGLYRRALAIREKLGDDHPGVARTRQAIEDMTSSSCNVS